MRIGVCEMGARRGVGNGSDNEDGPVSKLSKEGSEKVRINAWEAWDGGRRITGWELRGVSWKGGAWDSEWMQKTETVECGHW